MQRASAVEWQKPKHKLEMLFCRIVWAKLEQQILPEKNNRD